MRKVWVIAAREYRASVRTKAFLISLVMLPIMMGASVLVQVLLRNAEDAKEKHFAVIDRTPGHKLFDLLTDRAEERNKLVHISDPKIKKNLPKGEYVLERIEPSADDQASKDMQRLRLSKDVEQGKYQGFLEIGANVYDNHETIPPGEDPDDHVAVRFQSNKPQATSEFLPWAQQIVSLAVANARLVRARMDPEIARKAQDPVPRKPKGLSRLKPDGSVEETSEERLIANIVAPVILIALMFMMIMIGASPAMQSVLEEKMARIAEVLLGSVRPFDLMLGKLIGMVGVSLTVAAVYLGGAYVVALQYGYTDFLSPYLLAWFLVFQVMAVLMYGSLFIAIGAAANDMKETQSLLLPVMLVACLPMFVLGAIVTDPNSTFATICSFIPTATPMLMIARISVPPGVPLWEPLVGVIGVLAATTVCVYAAGRIFRVGILMQGKGVRLSDLVKWVVRG